jgi:hypothetical protein
MEADTEIKIQTRFEKYNEFVTLQDEALSLDTNPQVSDKESGRRINLMWNIVNIVRQTWLPVLLAGSLFEFSSQNTKSSRICWTHS